MNDALFVSGLEGFGDLNGDSQGFGNGYRTAFDFFSQSFSIDELHDKEFPSAGFLDSIDRCDVRMIERGQHTRLTLESRGPFMIMRECFRKQFDCDATTELRVDRLIHLSHATSTQMAFNLIVCEPCSNHDVCLRAASYQMTRG